MNTFTFTDDEVYAIKTSLDQHKNNLATFHSMLESTGVSQAAMQKRNSNIDTAIKKLEREPIIVGYADEGGNVTSHTKEKEGDS